ncbi:MAG: M20/M25/M40 family metallo-hydrolase [Candidatus Thorarchaeota archaeon]|nr:M20/M25/M40 family metallo-hydrolase [Candidatus Thorarchaeota archaeon]
MSDRILELLKELCAIPGPVGREDMVQNYVREHLKEFSDDIRTDKIGNVIATIEGTSKHYALVAHADEVGFFVSRIDDDGFLFTKWNTQGYKPDLRLLPGQWVLIMTDSGFIPGRFCVKTAHIAGPKGKNTIPKDDEVFIDIGVGSAEEVEEIGIYVGTPVVYAAPIERIGKQLMGKSFDDRIGLAQMIVLAEKISKTPKENRPTISLVSTVMEEIGAKGAPAIAQNLDVDGVLILEIGLADDYPGTNNEVSIGLGKGPVIVIKDTQIVYSHKLNTKIIATAEENNIDIQRAVYHNYATDGFPMAAHGQPVAVIAVPCRYSHSSFEAIDPTDVENTLDLIYHFLISEAK